MNHSLLKTIRTLLTGMLLLCVALAGAQTGTFKNGIQKGMVKVKFSPAAAPALVETPANARTSKFTTGIQRVDQVANSVRASNMTRLFPYDSRYEHKLRKHGLHLWYIIEMDETIDPQTVVTQFKQLPEVLTAEVEHEKVLAPYTVHEYTNSANARMSAAPFNDPLLKDQWHYNNTGQTGFADGADINLFEAWQTTSGAREIIVSVHDQGVDVNHPDLATNIWTNLAEFNGTDGVDDDGNGFIDDLHGWNFDKKSGKIDAEFHGTHVAGTIAAVNNNGLGVSGVAGGSGNNDGVRIMSLQSLGGGRIENTFIYAANNGSVISQNSWGYNEPDYFDQSILDAIDYFIEEAGDYPGSPMKGGVVIFAAGNSNWDAKWYPGYYQNTISVSSIGPDWKKASYSNFGTWVDIAAPGGEVQSGSKNGVLSTLPNSKYGYLEGTSMACPHVSGVAALVLANRTSQLTPAVLWTKLLTGVVDIDAHNPDYNGKLGSGMIDANLAIQNNAGIAPDAISDLSLVGIAQEFATITWTVPADQDDDQPVNFRVLVHTAPITAGNIAEAHETVIINRSAAGEVIDFSVENLIGQTPYYFAVLSTDRWNNISALSNVITGTTNEGPSIAVDENSREITLDINVTSGTTASRDITILNEAAGLLRWSYFTRHKNTSYSFSSAGIKYPQVTHSKVASLGKIGTQNTSTPRPAASITPTAFQEVEKRYVNYTEAIIGEEDLSLTNSSATKFFVNEEEGFNLTRVLMYLKHKPELGPVIVEIYKGTAINKQALVHAQEYTAGGNYEHTAYIDLTEQLYFEKGETFWVVFHVPAGNKYPLGIGWEMQSLQSEYCYMSFDLGKSWTRLDEILTGKPNKESYVWSTVAVSSNQYLGEYLTLSPSSGEIAGMDQGTTSISADASTLINGTYDANIIFTSNDASTPELRVPVTLNVSGHTPVLSSVETLDFSSVFQGSSKELTVTIRNTGLGNYNDATFETTNSHFEIKGWPPSQLKAKEDVTLTIRYTPSDLGNDNGLLKLTSASSTKTVNIILFGVSTPPAAISVSPSTQTIDNLTIGDEVTASITIENTGDAALKYFIPGFDQSGISDNWTEDYHSYGYKFRTSYAEDADPLSYAFEDISSTGTNITDYFKANNNRYQEIDMGFTFPYYKDSMTKLYISSKGFTTFSPDVNPINLPSLNGAPWSPKGYISVLGQFADLSTGGEIFYQVEPDRVIVQYSAIGEPWGGFNTAQMVLHADGNIRFYYENIQTQANYLTVLIEDFDQTDGILINNWQKSTPIYSGLALGFDYPGPNIITSISNAGGILLPGESAALDVTMNTSTLAEGEINRFINIISNDPVNSQQNALVVLNIIEGGVADVNISNTFIAFGDVFQGAVVKRKFTMKNNGTAPVTLTNFTLDNDQFIVHGNPAAEIKPGLAALFEVELPTETVTSRNDVLHITDSDGTQYTVDLSANVVDPPAVVTDLSPIVETLAHGETSSHPITFQNTGLADLEVVATGTQWLTMEKTIVPSSTPDYTYTYRAYNDGTNYQWLDIRKTGTQLPFITGDFFDPKQYWRTVELPRPVTFYGAAYTTMYVAENGLISFNEPEEVPFFTEYFPTETDYKTILAPYWAFAGIDSFTYPKEEVGLFLKIDDDKIIVSWEYLQDNFGGMADPMSAQVIFYNNGTMKFQYKINGNADAISNNAIIGMQNEDRSDFVTLNAYSNLPHGNGLAYIVTPAEKHTVAPGTTLEATIKINTANIYAGTYNDGLTIRTNVPNLESMFKPVELTVTGEAVIEVPGSLDFGSIMAYTTEEGPKTYSKEFVIRNTGVSPLSFSGMNIQSYSPEYIIETYIYDSWWGFWYWTDVSMLWEWPVVKPGEEIKMRVTSYPATTGDIAENLVINSNLGETIIPMSGTIVLPPVLSINTESVYSEVSNLTDIDTQTASIDNADGQSVLTYSISIDYNRTTAINIAGNETMATQAAPSTLKTVRASSTVKPLSTQTVFNRVLAHEDAAGPFGYLGYSGQYDFTVATQFNAGEDGFNVTHIQAYYRAPEAMNGIVGYEVRAGGSDISKAKVLSKGTFSYTYAGGETGEWLEIPLATSATVYPNEDFYIIVNYPIELEHPQGYIKDQGDAPGRYHYLYEGKWYDLQDEGFGGYAFLMRAGEQTFVSNSWVSVHGETSGTIEPGASLDIQLDFKAGYGERGDQFATILIHTNDPVNPSGEIPVTFHINAGPQFIGVPEIVRVPEGTTKTVTLQLNDIEGHNFTIAPKQSYAGMTYTVNGETLSITLSPDYNAAGTQAMVFEGTDDLGAVSSMTLNVEVINVNRAPAFIGDSKVMSFSASGQLNQYAMEDFFSDPDGDVLSFELTNSNAASVVVFASENEFIIRPMAIGEAKLAFAVADGQGAVTKDTITVMVDVVLGAEEDVLNNGLGAYPNPAVDLTTITVTNDWTGVVSLTVTDAAGRQYLTQEFNTTLQREATVDVSKLSRGIYILRAISKTKQATIKILKK